MFDEYKGFAFDLDGTLIDSKSCHVEAFADAVAELTGYQLTPAERDAFFQSHTLNYYPVLAGERNLTVDVQKVLARKRAIVDEKFEAHPYAGAVEFVRHWALRKKMALVTNSPLSVAQRAIGQLGLGDCFSTVVAGDQLSHKKPHPESYQRAARELSLPPQSLLVFEDTAAGIASAEEAGCRALLMNQSSSSVPGRKRYSWDDLKGFNRAVDGAVRR